MNIHSIADSTLRILSFRMAGNKVSEYAVFILILLCGFLFVKMFRRYVLRRLGEWAAKTESSWDDLVVSNLGSNAIPALYVFVTYLALHDLELKSSLQVGIWSVTTIGVTFFAIRAALSFVNHGIKSYWLRHAGEKTEKGEKHLNGLFTMSKIVMWMLGALLLMDNLGIKISAFMAGLGITGIAVALAAQTILGDLFSYFVIFFDQPFDIGHTIKVDNFLGEVEHIGIKTTRLRSVDGEQIIVSNRFLTESRVQNFTRMHRRRHTFLFEVGYGTRPDSLRAIPTLVKTILSRFSDVSLDRAHFKDFTPSGLRFEVVYFLETPNYGRFMDVQQELNLCIHEEFNTLSIEFAVPANLANMGRSNPD